MAPRSARSGGAAGTAAEIDDAGGRVGDNASEQLAGRVRWSANFRY